MKRPSTISEWLVVTIGTAFGLGLAPIAPGSFGALLGVGLHGIVWLKYPDSVRPILIGLFFGVCLIHTIMTSAAVRFWEDSDPKNFVLDEVAGYLLVAVIASGWVTPTLIMIEGYLLFRILDIIKPPPARQIDENMHTAMGVLLDDLVAACYASVILLAQNWLIQFYF